VPPGRQAIEKAQDRRRKKAYKWYKHYSKTTKASMCSIVDHSASDDDITRQDVDLLPWNPDESEVIRKVVKAMKKRMNTEKKDRKREKERKKMDKKEKDPVKATKLSSHDTVVSVAAAPAAVTDDDTAADDQADKVPMMCSDCPSKPNNNTGLTCRDCLKTRQQRRVVQVTVAESQAHDEQNHKPKPDESGPEEVYETEPFLLVKVPQAHDEHDTET
jgi:hypothetical protein